MQLPDGSVRRGAELGSVAVPVHTVSRSRSLLRRRRLRHIDDVSTVKRDVTHTAAERREVAEVDLAVRAADEYVPVDVQLFDTGIVLIYQQSGPS